jgi:hypothetical protein
MSNFNPYKNIENNSGKLNYNIRFTLYKEMAKIEPRMWTRNNHAFRMFSNCFMINFSFFIIYRIYYRHYNPNIGLIQSFIKSNRIKFLLLSMIFVDIGIIYLNYFKLDKYIYNTYYAQLKDEEILQMYEGIVKVKQIKNNDIYLN